MSLVSPSPEYITNNTTREHNGLARTQNCYVATANDDLHQLHNIETNLPIKRFPKTPGALKRMDNAALNAVLTELGIDILGTPVEKREKLRAACGLVSKPNDPA